MMATNTKKVVSYLLRNIEPVNINQIAKKTGVSVGSAFKILKELENSSIATTTKLGNASYCRLDTGNTETVKLCELILLEEKRLLKGYAKVYADEIKKFKDAELIVLFGSILRNREFNDVDVLFVAAKPKAVMRFCLELSKIRAKPVVPLILRKEGLIGSIKAKKEAIIDIIRTGIVLRGETTFIEVIGNARPQV